MLYIVCHTPILGSLRILSLLWANIHLLSPSHLTSDRFNPMEDGENHRKRSGLVPGSCKDFLVAGLWETFLLISQSSHLYNRYNDTFASPRVIMRFGWYHTADCPAYISKSSAHTHTLSLPSYKAVLKSGFLWSSKTELQTFITTLDVYTFLFTHKK